MAFKSNAFQVALGGNIGVRCLMSRLAALKNLVAGPLANVKAVCFLFPFRSQRN